MEEASLQVVDEEFVYKASDVLVQNVFELPIIVQWPQSTISYEFTSKLGDICMGIIFVAAMDEDREITDLDIETIEESLQYPSDEEAIKGSFIPPCEGVVYFVWNNDHDWYTYKKVSYTITVQQPSFSLVDNYRSQQSLPLLRKSVEDLDLMLNQYADTEDLIENNTANINFLQDQIKHLMMKLETRSAEYLINQTEMIKAQEIIHCREDGWLGLGIRSLEKKLLQEVFSYLILPQQQQQQQGESATADILASPYSHVCKYWRELFLLSSGNSNNNHSNNTDNSVIVVAPRPQTKRMKMEKEEVKRLLLDLRRNATYTIKNHSIAGQQQTQEGESRQFTRPRMVGGATAGAIASDGMTTTSATSANSPMMMIQRTMSGMSTNSAPPANNGKAANGTAAGAAGAVTGENLMIVSSGEGDEEERGGPEDVKGSPSRQSSSNNNNNNQPKTLLQTPQDPKKSTKNQQNKQQPSAAIPPHLTPTAASPLPNYHTIPLPTPDFVKQRVEINKNKNNNNQNNSVKIERSLSTDSYSNNNKKMVAEVSEIPRATDTAFITRKTAGNSYPSLPLVAESKRGPQRMLMHTTTTTSSFNKKGGGNAVANNSTNQVNGTAAAPAAAAAGGGLTTTNGVANFTKPKQQPSTPQLAQGATSSITAAAAGATKILTSPSTTGIVPTTTIAAATTTGGATGTTTSSKGKGKEEKKLVQQVQKIRTEQQMTQLLEYITAGYSKIDSLSKEKRRIKKLIKAWNASYLKSHEKLPTSADRKGHLRELYEEYQQMSLALKIRVEKMDTFLKKVGLSQEKYEELMKDQHVVAGRDESLY